MRNFFIFIFLLCPFVITGQSDPQHFIPRQSFDGKLSINDLPVNGYKSGDTLLCKLTSESRPEKNVQVLAIVRSEEIEPRYIPADKIKDGCFSFKVSANNGIMVTLNQFPTHKYGGRINLLFGGWDNTKCGITLADNTIASEVLTPRFFNTDNFMDLWFNYKDGLIQGGRGNNSQPIFTYQMPNMFPVNFISFRPTSHGERGEIDIIEIQEPYECPGISVGGTPPTTKSYEVGCHLLQKE